MSPSPIQTDEDYRVALKKVSALFNNEPEPGTPEGDYFDELITLIEAYEAKLHQRFATKCAPKNK
ncbi:HTH-type transcriptional regulator / antitoxin HigA [Pseudomonas granadensis]|nr:HTH-type transcriptional regulator / antitoxin HigA [Pseudomonas granadensis]